MERPRRMCEDVTEQCSLRRRQFSHRPCRGSILSLSAAAGYFFGGNLPSGSTLMTPPDTLSSSSSSSSIPASSIAAFFASRLADPSAFSSNRLSALYFCPPNDAFLLCCFAARAGQHVTASPGETFWYWGFSATLFLSAAVLRYLISFPHFLCISIAPGRV